MIAAPLGLFCSAASRPERAWGLPRLEPVRRRGTTAVERSFFATAVLIHAGAIILNLLGRQGLPLACPFRHALGMPCPTCGTTTALLALARGELGAAWAANPVATVVGVFMGAFVPYLVISVAVGWALRPNRALRAWTFWLAMGGLLLAWLHKLDAI